MPWRIASGSIDLQHPVFLGILNVTPDSFSDGGRHLAPSDALERAAGLCKEGAAVLDVGAESTRPGAEPLAPKQEWGRLEPVLDLVQQEIPDARLSLDTRHAAVAASGLERGVDIVNDIAGFSDPDMLRLAAASSCGLIAMRSRTRDGRLFMPDYGTEGETSPDRAIRELQDIKDRLLGAGIAADRILLDPGFGFGTTFQEDLVLWKALPLLPGQLAWPVERFCIGISRKRLLAWRSGNPALAPDCRDELTREAHAEAASWGYRVFRTHVVTAF